MHFQLISNTCVNNYKSSQKILSTFWKAHFDLFPPTLFFGVIINLTLIIIKSYFSSILFFVYAFIHKILSFAFFEYYINGIMLHMRSVQKLSSDVI